MPSFFALKDSGYLNIFTIPSRFFFIVNENIDAINHAFLVLRMLLCTPVCKLQLKTKCNQPFCPQNVALSFYYIEISGKQVIFKSNCLCTCKLYI